MVQPGQVYLVFSLFTFQGAFLSYIWPALWIASCVTTRVGIHVGVNSFSGGDLVHLVHNVLILEVRQHEGMHSGVKYLGFIHIAHHAAGTYSGASSNRSYELAS